MLCYHGVSLDDEHEWSGLYMPIELLRERCDCLRKSGCTILPLDTAIQMLYSGTLPPRAVVITFDDGFYDFYSRAYPILRQYDWPITVYLTTYYSQYNVPVFDPMVSYLLWKGRGNLLDWPEMGIAKTQLDTEGRAASTATIRRISREQQLGGAEKNALLGTLAQRLNLDLAALSRRRILHLMTPSEVRELSTWGVDFQLHCHRHRVYRVRERFLGELKDNTDAIQRCGAPPPAHFCYPSGFHLPEFPQWLEEFGVRSATTCETGLASTHRNRFRLPRLLDQPSLSMDEFAGWLSGVAAWIPRKHYQGDATQLAD